MFWVLPIFSHFANDSISPTIYMGQDGFTISGSVQS
jgi:hypothetical protein